MDDGINVGGRGWEIELDIPSGLRIHTNNGNNE